MYVTDYSSEIDEVCFFNHSLKYNFKVAICQMAVANTLKQGLPDFFHLRDKIKLKYGP